MQERLTHESVRNWPRKSPCEVKLIGDYPVDKWIIPDLNQRQCFCYTEWRIVFELLENRCWLHQARHWPPGLRTATSVARDCQEFRVLGERASGGAFAHNYVGRKMVHGPASIGRFARRNSARVATAQKSARGSQSGSRNCEKAGPSSGPNFRRRWGFLVIWSCHLSAGFNAQTGDARRVIPAHRSLGQKWASGGFFLSFPAS